MIIPKTLLGAHTCDDDWTFCYDRKYNIYAQSLRAQNITHYLGQATSLVIADAICRAFARRSHVNTMRLTDIFSFAYTGYTRAASSQKRKRPTRGEMQLALKWLSDNSITVEVIPFAYTTDRIGFVLVGADSEGRYCTMPSFGPAKSFTSATQFLCIVLAGANFLDRRAYRARLAVPHLPPAGTRAVDLPVVLWQKLSQRWPAWRATSADNRRRGP